MLIENKKKLAVFALPVVIILLMTIAPIFTILFGKEVVLETQPFDPRDLFRGDHVMLNYKITDIPASMLNTELKQKLTDKKYQVVKNMNLYAEIVPQGNFYVVKSISDKRPGKGLYLKCRLLLYNPLDDMLNVDYNLDKFFVAENTGNELEKLSREGKLVARIKILRGYPVLIGITPVKN